MAKAKVAESQTIEIAPVLKGELTIGIKGTSPIIFNRMSSKVGFELLIPKGKKTTAQKQANLKHNPYAEFQSSVYTNDDENSPTLLEMFSTAFKKATMGAALDIPGAKKAQIGRLVWVVGDRAPIYGIPQLMMTYVRMADINRTPDVRTRAIVPKWASKLSISFVRPLLNEKTILNLLSAAGMIQGVGEWRPEKGSGAYGQFELCGLDDPEFKAIVRDGGRAEQIAAMSAFEPYDDETRTLLEHFNMESIFRGLDLEEMKRPLFA